MTEFSAKEDNHEYINFLFDGCKEIDEFKKYNPDVRIEVISGKRVERLKAMVKEAQSSGERLVLYTGNAVKSIMVSDNPEERLLAALGYNAGKCVGKTVCKSCLDRAIGAVEEYAGILKDIQASIK